MPSQPCQVYQASTTPLPPSRTRSLTHCAKKRSDTNGKNIARVPMNTFPRNVRTSCPKARSIRPRSSAREIPAGGVMFTRRPGGCELDKA